MYVLFTYIVIFILGLIDFVLLDNPLDENSIGVFTGLYALVTFIPSLAVGIRRLYDVGKSGWWILISIIPLIGAIILLYFSVLDSQPQENNWGPSPKYQTLE